MQVALRSQGVALGFTILPFQGNFSVNLSRSLSLCSVVVLAYRELDEVLSHKIRYVEETIISDQLRVFAIIVAEVFSK